MTEGRPSIGEVQPLRGRERFSQWARETFTLEGRTDYRMRNNLAKVHETLETLHPQERIAKMEELYEASRSAAVKSVVRDVAIIVSAAGAGGLAYNQRERIGRSASALGKKMYDLTPEKTQARYDRALNNVKVEYHRTHEAFVLFVNQIRTVSDKLGGFVAGMVSRVKPGGVEQAPPVELGAILGAFQSEPLDALNQAHPSKDLLKDAGRLRLSGSVLNNSQAEHLAGVLVGFARKFGKWTPILMEKGQFVGFQASNGFEVDREGIWRLVDHGMVTMEELGDGRKAFIPTAAFVEFVKKYIVS